MTRVMVLTGAGISAESGIATFRGHDGLWEGHRPEDVATPEAFASDPELVHRFYNARRRQLLQVQPNEAHRALARFESLPGVELVLVTQNVDDLHARAGSKNILPMHGQLLRARCLLTGVSYPWQEDLTTETPHPEHADQRGLLRPDIVWFGEMPMHLEEIEEQASKADIFMAIGTSSVVYPAASIVQWTPATCRRVEINLEDTPQSPVFNEALRGLATVTVPKFLKDLANEISGDDVAGS